MHLMEAIRSDRRMQKTGRYDHDVGIEEPKGGVNRTAGDIVHVLNQECSDSLEFSH